MDKLITIKLINQYLERYERDIHALKTLNFVIQNDIFWQRENVEGHITASAWVIDKNCSKTLLIHHPKLLQWFQPGGHVEASDATLFDAALREAIEETGISGLQIIDKQIFDIDVHLIPSYKNVMAHYHYDLRILVEASAINPKNENENEMLDLQWISLDKVSDYNNSEPVMRLVEKGKKEIKH